ncbi:MAG TPA: zf-HC2 domain-containing protein [Gemmatimonadales bacterium]|nr:zf-HC2 domain-containing protein [Gemmatimonadales bacterium]
MTHLTERLSDYLDGSLPPSEREEVERHLAACEECSNTLADLRGVVARVQALNDRPPAGDLWPGIAAFIGEGEVVRPIKRSRRVVFTVPQLLAAAIALMLLSAAGVAWFLRGHAADQAQIGTPAVIPASNKASNLTPKGYDAAVTELQQVLTENRGKLDSTTVRVLESKLALIDKAIGEAQQALASDPKNPYLHGHLAETQMQKVELLQRAALLAARKS